MLSIFFVYSLSSPSLVWNSSELAKVHTRLPMQFNFVDFVVALACSEQIFCIDYLLISVRWLISIEEEPFHDSKLFTYSLNDNKAKARVIKITLVSVDVIYSHFRISVNCLNHFDWVSPAQMEIGLKHVLVIISRLTLAGFAKFPAPTSLDTDYNLQSLVKPCCLRVEQALLQWHGSDSYT